MNTRTNWAKAVGAGTLLAAALFFAGSCSKQPPSGGAAVQGASSGQGGSAAGGRGGRRAAIVPVQAFTVQVGILNADRTTAGVVEPVTQSNVATQVAGFVTKVPRQVGDWVKSGEVVVQLDDSQLKLTLASAKAGLENAKINLAIGADNATQASPKLALQVQSAQSAYDSAKKFYDSQQALFNLGGISASVLDTADSQLTAAEANLEGAKTALDQNNKSDEQTIEQLKLAMLQAQNQVDQAQLNLDNSSIKAPFAGQIAAINMQPGMYANVSTPVFTLVSVEKEISFNVPPSDAAFLKAGMSITFDFQGKGYPVRISQAPSAPISGVLPMVATGSGINLQYGAVGEIDYRIPLAQGALIPLASLDTLENQNFVYVITNGHVSVRNVTITAESGVVAAVANLKDGEVIVVSPPPGLLEGTQVQPTMTVSLQGIPSAAPLTGGKQTGTQGQSGSQGDPSEAPSGQYQIGSGQQGRPNGKTGSMPEQGSAPSGGAATAGSGHQ